MSDILTERFTLVFEGNLREFKGNPFKIETPYGIPVVIGVGDAFEECEKLREELSAIAALIDAHREEFEATITANDQRRAWLEKKAANEKRKAFAPKSPTHPQL